MQTATARNTIMTFRIQERCAWALLAKATPLA